MFKHKKKLGQNFLINKEIIKKIADIGNVDRNTNIIEIGPGSGNLTEELLKKNPKEIFALEFDKDLSNYLDKIKNNFKNFNYNAINITIGLPFIRISPDHGVGTEIIGKGVADPKSFKKAIRFFSKYNV